MIQITKKLYPKILQETKNDLDNSENVINLCNIMRIKFKWNSEM